MHDVPNAAVGAGFVDASHQAAYQAARNREQWKRAAWGAARWVLITVWVICLMAVFLGGIAKIAADGINVRIIITPPLPAAPTGDSREETKA